MSRKLYLLDLFAGIGGFALAAYRAGLRFDKHYCSEIEPFAVDLYAKRFPDSIQLGDIRKINVKELQIENADYIICGGFPCQDISGIGRKKGITGEKSKLWFDYANIIMEIKPKFVIIENVQALTFRGLDTVLKSLARVGFDAEWQVISAKAFRAPHLRRRLWIVAYPHTIRRHYRNCDVVSRSRERNIKTPKMWSRLSQVPYRDYKIHNWEDHENIICRDDDGIPPRMDKSRIAALGNAIVPQNAQFIFNRIKELLDSDKSRSKK